MYLLSMPEVQAKLECGAEVADIGYGHGRALIKLAQPYRLYTRMDLLSLFGSWAAQGLNPFFQCLAQLSQQSSLLEA